MNAIRSSGQFCVPENYEKQFYEAELTFLFQRVYCPKSKSMVHLSEDIEGKLLAFQDLSFLGPFLDDSIVQGIASGKLCPNTYEPFDEESLLVTSPFVSLVKPTILQGTSGALKMPANGASKTIAKVISEIPQGRTTVKSQIEFWKRVTLKRTHKQLEAVLTPAKKAKEIIEGIMDSTLEPIESPYFSKKAVQDNSCELTHTVDDHEVIRRSPRIHRTYPSTKLASPQPPSKSQELFFAKENTRNNNITKEKTITNVRSMTTKKFVSSSANSPGARTLIDGNVKHFLDSFAANPIVLTGSLYSKNESRPTRATGRK